MSLFSYGSIKSLVHKNKKASVIFLFIIGVLLLSSFSVLSSKYFVDDKAVSVSSDMPYLKAYVVKQGPFVHSVDDIYGKITASESELAFRISGVVKEVLVDKGDVVEKGQSLAKIDDTDIFLLLKEREIKLKAAQIELKKAEKTLANNEQKNESGYITASKLEDYAFDVELKRSAFESAEINLRMARLDYEKTNLTAPFDGVVIERKCEVGESIKIGESSFVFMNASDVYADIEISQADSDHIEAGQKVILSSGDNDVFEGKIKAVIPALLGRAMVLTARVVFDKKDNNLLPGTFVSGRVILHQANDVLSVPVDYIFEDEKGFYVWHYRDDCTVSRAYVETGYMGRDNLIIKKGLVPDMILVKSDDMVLSDNMQVSIDL